MTMSETFAGIRIDGDRSRYTRQLVPQRPKEELIPIMLDVLNDERVKYVVWTQYTPFFNDGEPCEFSVGDFGFILNDVDYSETLKAYGYSSEEDLTRVYADELSGVWNTEDGDLKDKMRALGKTGGPFEDAYYELFGDHARIVASRERFIIDEYEHD
jgi:hypothetical protein